MTARRKKYQAGGRKKKTSGYSVTRTKPSKSAKKQRKTHFTGPGGKKGGGCKTPKQRKKQKYRP